MRRRAESCGYGQTSLMFAADIRTSTGQRLFWLHGCINKLARIQLARTSAFPQIAIRVIRECLVNYSIRTQSMHSLKYGLQHGFRPSV